MKLSSFLHHLRSYNCILKREGGAHSIWMNPETKQFQAVPRHTEIPNGLARTICKKLSIPQIGRNH